jgi:hypothetical protein
MFMDEAKWYSLELPFLLTAYFECEYCHRPIEVHSRSDVLKTGKDWDDYTFDIRCACGWGHTAYSGSKAVYRNVVEWKSKVRSTHHSDT